MNVLNLRIENFTKLCHVDADVSHLPMSAQKNDNGKTYYQSPTFFDCTSVWVH